MNNLPTKPVAASFAQQRFITKVYCWMAGALIITAATALFAASSITFMRLILTNSIALFALLIGEVALVVWLSAGIRKMKASTAIFAFIAYSVVNGLTLSVIFYAYNPKSIVLAFLLSAATFGSMSIYGLVTKNDLTRAGSYLMMALFGLIIASVVNIFFRSDAFTWIVSVATVVVFTGLTAYDNQKLKKIAAAEGDSEIYTKQAIYGALNLYLDFINIFLALLRLFGKKN